MQKEVRRTLYRSGNLWVQRCECGVFHVHVGPTTMRFDQESFEEFLSGLGEAMTRSTMWRFSDGAGQFVGTA
ncbi:MAG: hypothetical protein AAGF92_18480 [Myxococcota bacterium]